MEYFDVYLKRLNRYGIDYQSRIQGQREKVFEDLLLKSIYRVDFEYDRQLVPGLLERYKQDETETLQYLLTRVNMDIPAGTVLMIPDKNKVKKPWMVYWLENIKASGYNRYIMLKMSHFITWKDRNGEQQTTWAYLYGQENNMLKDEIRSRSRMDTVYAENLKLNFFILPLNENIQKDDYLVIGEGKLAEAYVVTGYDRHSSEGVEYVSIDPVYLRDETPAPEQSENDEAEDFFWLNGGAT